MTSTAAPSTATRKTSANQSTPLSEQLAQLRDAMNARVQAGDGEKAVEMLLAVIESQHRDIARLEKNFKAAVRARFGRRSEKLTASEFEQLALALGSTAEEATRPDAQVPVAKPAEETDPDASEDQPRRKKGCRKGRHPGRSRLDPNLARRINMHPVPEKERDCIHCGATMQAIGHVDHERVEFIPGRLEVIVDRREKVACTTCHQDVTTAPRPPAGAVTTQPDDADAPVVAPQSAEKAAAQAPANDPLAPGARVYRRAGASLLAQLLEAKCDDAMPIYRQRQQLARLGYDVPLNTLYGYWDAASQIIQPVAQVVLSEVLGQPIVGLDDTRLDWLDPKAAKVRRRGHLWCFVGSGDLVAFEFTESWLADEVAPWIDAMDGFLQVDDYKGYSALRPQEDGAKVPLVPPERRLGCWMHVRRRFHQAFKAGEKHAVIPLGHIKELYAVEREARDANMTPAQRHALRQRKSQPVAEAFFAWVRQRQLRERPGSYVGMALRYARDQEPFVMRCLSDGRFELDTGRVERQIREPVIGRKNYLFSGSAAAARRLAGAYSLVCSCQNLGIDTRAYLTDIITKLQAGFPLRHINRLRPDIWADDHASMAGDQVIQ